jgi:DNA primase
MGIHEEDVAAVRAASDIVAIVSQYTPLRKVGRRWLGLCPFHSEKTPSFSVNSEENVYYCFGCQARGDVISFLMDKEQLDFPRAVESLAAKANITLRYTDRDQGEGRKRRAKLVDTVARAVDWYHERLLTGRDAGAARSYLRSRGLDGDVVREFRIGWAPEDRDALCRALGLNDDLATGTGLGRPVRGRLQDHFRSRVMFPIRDDRGDPISFGGRILPGGETEWNRGKYKNTTETPLYNKSKVLYGLDRAKAAIVTAGTAVICEGYTDVIGFQRSGVPLAVATCGTALTDEHVTLLGRFAARRLVLAFDADGAGQAAAERFYRWEREHDLEVAVADLPAGQDPADVARNDPARLAAAVERATPFLRFRLERAFAAADLTSNEGRARAAEGALAIVAEHPSELVRDQYVMDVASRCRIEPDRLRPMLDRVRSRPRAAAGASPSSSPSRSASSVSPRVIENRPDDFPTPAAGEAAGGGGPGAGPTNGARPGRARTDGPAHEVLLHAVHDPAAVGRWLDAALFDDPVQRAAYELLLSHDTHAEALAAAPPDVADLLARLLVEEPTSDPFDPVRRLYTEVTRREIARVRLAASTASDGTRALADVATLTAVMDGLRHVETATDSAGRLLAWLGERVGDGG